MSINKKPCIECRHSEHAELSRGFICDKDESSYFLHEMVVFDKTERGEKLRQLMVMDCAFFEVQS